MTLSKEALEELERFRQEIIDECLTDEARKKIATIDGVLDFFRKNGESKLHTVTQRSTPREPSNNKHIFASCTTYENVIQIWSNCIRALGRPVKKTDVAAWCIKNAIVLPDDSTISKCLVAESNKQSGARLIRVGWGLYGLPGSDVTTVVLKHNEQDDKDFKDAALTMLEGEAPFVINKHRIERMSHGAITEEEIKQWVKLRLTNHPVKQVIFEAKERFKAFGERTHDVIAQALLENRSKMPKQAWDD